MYVCVYMCIANETRRRRVFSAMLWRETRGTRGGGQLSAVSQHFAIHGYMPIRERDRGAVYPEILPVCGEKSCSAGKGGARRLRMLGKGKEISTPMLCRDRSRMRLQQPAVENARRG